MGLHVREGAMISAENFFSDCWYVKLLDDGKGGIERIGSYDAEKRVDQGFAADPAEHDAIYAWDDLASTRQYGYFSYRGEPQLVGIDIDLHKGEIEMDDLTFEHGDDADWTPLLVETPSGGLHFPVLIRFDEGQRVESNFETIDVKGEGANAGYLVLPTPSSDYEVNEDEASVPVYAAAEVENILKVDGQSALSLATDGDDGESVESSSEGPLAVTDVVDVPLETNVPHPFHGSSTDQNFRADGNNWTWHCYRDGHDCTGNAYHLAAIEGGILECGEWMDNEGYAGKWSEIEDYCQSEGYEVDPWNNIRWQYNNSEVPKFQARNASVEQLTSEYVFATAKQTDVLYVYEDGIYIPEGEIVVKQRLRRKIGRHFSRREAEEAIHAIKAETYTDIDQFGPDESDPKVCVENGVLEFDTSDGFDVRFRDHSPADMFLKKLPVTYDPSADPTPVDRFIDSVVATEDDMALLYEMIGYCLWPGYGLEQKFLMIYGDGANGKTIFLNMVEEFLGETVHHGLQELVKDKFAVANLHGAFANISGELPSKKLFDTNTIKALTGGDRVKGERKYESPFYFKNKAKFIFSTNEPPVIEDPTHGFVRRLLLVEFPYTFESDPVRGRELKEELTTDEALSGLLNRALDGLGRVATRGFSEVYSPDELADRYQQISDPIAEFAEECLENVQGSSTMRQYLPKTDVYAAYTEWAKAAGKRTKNKKTFYTALERTPAVTTLEYRPKMDDGTRPRCYKNIKFTETGKEFVKYD